MHQNIFVDSLTADLETVRVLLKGLEAPSQINIYFFGPTYLRDINWYDRIKTYGNCNFRLHRRVQEEVSLAESGLN